MYQDLPDAFIKSNKDKEDSVKTQVQLFLEEVMQEVETVMDDLSAAVTQNVTVKLSSIIDCDARFCTRSLLYLQVQVQSFLDEVYMKVDQQISSIYYPVGFSETNELKDDEEQIDVGNSNTTNLVAKQESDDNEVKIVMNNILGNLKDLLGQEDNNCASVKTDIANSDSHTHKNLVINHEKSSLPESKNEEIIPELSYEHVAQTICEEKNNASASLIPCKTNEENESPGKFKPDDKVLNLQLPTDTKNTIENMPPILMKDNLQPQGSKKRSFLDTLSASQVKKAKVFSPLKDQNSPCMSGTHTHNLLKDYVQTEGNHKRHMEDTLPATSPEKKAKLFDSPKDQNSSCTFNGPNSTQSIHLNVSTSSDQKNSCLNCSNKEELIIPNNSGHEEENVNRKNEDQTVPSIMPPVEEAIEQSGNDIVADASLYSSVGSNEKVEEKLQCAVSDSSSNKVIPETSNDSREQNNEEDTVSQMVPSIQDSDAVTDILQTLQYHSQQPSTVGVPPLLMPVFNIGQLRATGPLERLPPIPACNRQKRVGLSRRQAIPHLHTVSREFKPLVPKETEQ